MFDDLRAAFREALDNFNKELSRDQVGETADKLLVGMKNEIADEKAQVAGLEDHLAKSREQIERLSKDIATALRREEMAAKIEDAETVKLAKEYALKADGHRQVLERKVAALEEERAFRQRTLDEMYEQFHAAREKREALKAATGRSGARETLGAANDLFDELDRMADKIEGNRARGEAAEAFSEIDLGQRSEYHVDVDDAPDEPPLDVDAALAELKRRMGEK